MPLMELTVPEEALSETAKVELPEKMAETLLKWEGAPDTEFFRSISWVHLQELPAEAIRTPDGVAAPHAVIVVSTPEGALSERRRAGLVEDLTNLVMEATGWEEEARLRVWVIGREVDEGKWGAGGQIIHFEQLREAAKAERDKEGSGREEIPAASEKAEAPA